MATNRNLRELRGALCDARDNGATLHVVRNRRDLEFGESLGRTRRGWLLFRDADTGVKTVLFTGWLPDEERGAGEWRL